MDQYWDSIHHILNLYLPTFQKLWINGDALDETMGEHFEDLRHSRNPKLIRAFHAALWNAPDEHCGEWHHKDWNVFYDLCLNEWCMYEEREADEE